MFNVTAPGRVYSMLSAFAAVGTALSTRYSFSPVWVGADAHGSLFTRSGILCPTVLVYSRASTLLPDH